MDFRGESKNFILNDHRLKISQTIMVFFLELYQLFFLFLKTLIIWINLSLEFSLKVICRIWMFRVDGKHFILNGSWWRISQCIMVLFLELYKLLFLCFKTLTIWRTLRLEVSESNNFILNFSDDNMFYLYFMSSLIWCRLSSCLLNIW